MVIGIVMGIAFAACSPSVKVPEPVEGPSLELSAIDSLMWRQPDSALAQLQAFCNSPEADSLDEFDGHYCQLLISELLYKNYAAQSNREGLLQAVAYFDSIMQVPEPVEGSSFERNVFLAARAHYINGVGYYEHDSVVNACTEYLKALEVMEAHFEENELVGHKARFLAYTYNRLGDLFSEQFMMESSITCYEKALIYCRIEPTSPIGVSSILYRIGKQYAKKKEMEIAQSYFHEALEDMTVTDNMVYRDIVANKALCDYHINGVAKQSLDELNRVLFQARTENERLNRYLTIGGVFFYEGNYDSALFYLEPVFENNEAGLQAQAAGYLRIIYDSIGNREQSDAYMRFLTKLKKPDGENKALVSKLEDLFKEYQDQKQERQVEIEREKAMKIVGGIIISIAGVALGVFLLLVIRNKKQLKRQKEEADEAFKEADQEHEKELRLWQAEADKTLEETEKKYEAELEQLKTETKQHLAEAEKKHQQWMADAEERHSEELRTQKDRADKEMEKTKKRHDEELKAMRLAHQQEMETKEQAARHEREQYEEASRQRDAKAAQRLEEAEQQHREKTAEMAQRHEEEMRSQQDKTEDEISATQKRYEQELEAVRQAHQQEMEAKAAEAKADRELHEEELRRRREQAEQWLAEAEQDHRRKVAELAKRQEEETRRQQEKMEQEREQAKKRHEAELEAERMAYRKEQEALRQSLRQREVQVNALEMAMGRQREEAERRREAFLKEPICQRILGQVRRKTITTRENAFELGLSLKDEDFEQLGTAVEKHYEGFDNMLLSQCPSLKQGLISLCHLHLLGINESEIAVLKNVSYSAIKKQNESLQEKLGVEEDVASYIMRVIEGLCGTQNGTQGGTQTNGGIDDNLDAWIERQIKDNPKISTEELAQKSHKGVRTIKRHISTMSHIRYVGSGYSGHWEVVR